MGFDGLSTIHVDLSKNVSGVLNLKRLSAF